MKKLHEGDLCLFDPYNLLNTKETYNNIKCVRVIKYKRHLFREDTIDCVDIESGFAIMDLPRRLLIKADLNKPNIIIRNPRNIPMITKSDMDLLNSLYAREQDTTYKNSIGFLICKMSQYQIAEAYTNMMVREVEDK